MEVWFNPSCSKCRLAAQTLDAEGVSYSVRRYLDDPPTRGELAGILDELGLQPWDIARTGEPEAVELGLRERARDDRDAWIDLLAAHPRLIQRPILRAADGSAWIARTDDALRTAVAHERGAAS